MKENDNINNSEEGKVNITHLDEYVPEDQNTQYDAASQEAEGIDDPAQSTIGQNPEQDYDPVMNTDFSEDGEDDEFYQSSDEVEPLLAKEDYKASIRKLKEEYAFSKKLEKENKKRQKAQNNGNYQGNDSGNGKYLATALISVIASIAVCTIAFLVITFYPDPQNSLLASIVDRVSGPISADSSTVVGGQDIDSGDNVTINVETSSVASAVYAKASPSVVGIAVVAESGSKWNPTLTTIGMGSGIIYSSDGIIVTNYHVVEQAIDSNTKDVAKGFEIRVYFKTDLTDYSTVLEVIGYDAAADLAVLKVNASGLKPIEFADSDKIEIGSMAVAIGSPGGLAFMNSVSDGIISGINRSLSTDTGVVYDLLQTTAAINPGNSGGALLNENGELIGICVMKLVSSGYESMGFAISSNNVKRIVSAICETGSYVQPTLGVTVDTTYTSDIAKEKGWPNGAYVYEITPDSAADKAGIKPEDIIVEMNGVTINDFYDLRRMIVAGKIGDEILIKLYRLNSNGTGEYLEVTAVLQ